jgi:hypothetical protein
VSEDDFERQAEAAKRRTVVSFQTVALLVVIAVSVQVFVGAGPGQIAWVLAAVFAVIAIFELLNWMSLLRHSGNPPEGGRGADDESSDMKDDFELTVQDGDVWLERRVAANGGTIVLRIASEPDIASRARPQANGIIADLPAFLASLQEFKAEEKARRPELAVEIEGLKLESIEFFSSKTPEVPEVVFEEVPSGRVWACAYEQGVFYNLGFDD